MKYIEIASCNNCPHMDHKGAFAAISYVPVCRKTGKELPHTISYSAKIGASASYTGIIPSFCPLPDLKD